MVQTLEKSAPQLSPEPLYELALGFAGTKTLLAANRLGIFNVLEGSPKTAPAVADVLNLSPEATEILLNTCVCLGLCSKVKGYYSNRPLAEQFLVKDKPHYLGRFFDHFNDHMYPAWFHLEDAVRTGKAQIGRVVGNKEDHFFQAIDRKSDDLETFMLTMEEHSVLEGEALAASHDFSGFERMLDVAGGTGAMSAAIVTAHPHLRSTVFDRPPVCEITKRLIAQKGLSNRISVQPGDMFTDALPNGADVVLLSAILHNWDREHVHQILTQIYKAMTPGGTLLISEQLLSQDKTGPQSAILCSLNMLLMLGGAQEYNQAEYEAFLNEAGFDFVESKPTGGIRQLLVARRR